MDEFKFERKKEVVSKLLYEIGEDVQRSGLIDTPKRVVKSWDQLFSGYNQQPKDVLTVFDEKYDEIILLKNIELYSMCEHHMLPFIGKAHVAYIPNGKSIVGISKLARLVEIFARRLQIQERIGMQVTQALMELLEPQGAACIIEAQHLCMQMRGVEKQNSVMVTSDLKGVFRDNAEARNELLNLIKL